MCVNAVKNQGSIKAASKILLSSASQRQLTTHIRHVGDAFCWRHNSSAEMSQQKFGFDRQTVPDLTAEDRGGTERLQLETEEVGRDCG
jgi:hypothetical protein